MSSVVPMERGDGATDLIQKELVTLAVMMFHSENVLQPLLQSPITYQAAPTYEDESVKQNDK